MLLAAVLALLAAGCVQEIQAPREYKTQVKVSLAAADSTVDHGWLTIDLASEDRHRMDLVGSNLTSAVIELSPGEYHFEVIAVDADPDEHVPLPRYPHLRRYRVPSCEVGPLMVRSTMPAPAP